MDPAKFAPQILGLALIAAGIAFIREPDGAVAALLLIGLGTFAFSRLPRPDSN